MAQNSPQHFLTFPFEFARRDNGGLPSVILAEARSGRDDLHILSTDPESFNYKGVKIHAADLPEIDDSGRFGFWFGTGCWSLLHPDAHTAVSVEAETLLQMYGMEPQNPELRKIAAAAEVGHQMLEAARSTQDDLGSFCQLLEFVEAHADSQSHLVFNSRFRRLIAEIPDGSIINWQDYFFEPLINEHADQLRARGCRQTFHLHTTLPSTLYRSAWGRELLIAMSRMDVVYLHTDRYIENLRWQFEVMKLTGHVSDPLPEIRRFNLGINEVGIAESLATINQGNYETSVPGYHKLSARQKGFISEVFLSYGNVRNRFMCADRADPGKGLITVADAVDLFCENEIKRAEQLGQDGMTHLLNNFRFFFLHDLITIDNYHSHDLKEQYIKIVKQKLDRLQRKFPGVVWVSEGISGDQRVVVPALFKGCHGLSGGAQDGLNLFGMEISAINVNEATALIMGNGTGFAIQASQEGYGSAAEFVKAGDRLGFEDALTRVSYSRSHAPGALLRQKARLVEYINKRRDTVVVD